MDQALEALQQVVSGKRGRQRSVLTEGGRAALSLVLSERRSGASDPRLAGFRGVRAPAAVSGTERRVIPVLSSEAELEIETVIAEYERKSDLQTAGLAPTRSILLSGEPGVGKTLTMLHIATRLGKPLVRVEPSDVIGSYLGESARNLSDAFARARSAGAVLGLDEIDALAKRRDDTQDVGEFKRFVSTLLLELDRWDGMAPVIGATNHLGLLDPALERRFDLHLRLDPPAEAERERLINDLCGSLDLDVSPRLGAALVTLSEGLTGAAITQRIERAARRVILGDEATDATLLRSMAAHRLGSHDDRARVAAVARDEAGMTLRQIGDLLDCSHTAARHLAEAGRLKSRGSAR